LVDLLSLISGSLYYRRFDRPKYYLGDGSFDPAIFACDGAKHDGMSLTLKNPYLQTKQGTDHYHFCSKLPSNDLPGIAEISFDEISATGLSLSYKPKSDKFGHLHYETTLKLESTNPDHVLIMDKLCMAAGERRLVRKFVDKDGVGKLSAYANLTCN